MRAGVTLLELLVTILVLAVLVTLTGVPFSTSVRTSDDTYAGKLLEGRRAAVRSGRAVLVAAGRDTVTLLPDGRAIRNLWARRMADPVTGEILNATR